jgi:hypothetical protein
MKKKLIGYEDDMRNIMSSLESKEEVINKLQVREKEMADKYEEAMNQ